MFQKELLRKSISERSGGGRGICLSSLIFGLVAIVSMPSRRTFQGKVIRNIILVQNYIFKKNVRGSHRSQTKCVFDSRTSTPAPHFWGNMLLTGQSVHENKRKINFIVPLIPPLILFSSENRKNKTFVLKNKK